MAAAFDGSIFDSSIFEAGGGNITFSYTGTSGLALSCASNPRRGKVIAASSGIAIGASSSVVRGAVRSAVSGILLAGSAAIARGISKAAASGISLGGTASVVGSYFGQSVTVVGDWVGVAYRRRRD